MTFKARNGIDVNAGKFSVNKDGDVFAREVNQIVNVKAFGAVGDSVTNDSDAIAMASEFCLVNGGILFFPKGDYYHPNYEIPETVGQMYETGEIIQSNRAFFKFGTKKPINKVKQGSAYFDKDEKAIKLFDGNEWIKFLRKNGSDSIEGDLTVKGNLVVEGEQVILNTATLEVEDNIVLLNKGVTGVPTLNAGIEVERGSEENVSIIFDETADVWKLKNAKGELSKIEHGLTVNVKDFGAKGDKKTDDTQAFVAAYNYCKSNGGVFYVPENFKCYIPNGVDLFGLPFVKIEGEIHGSSVDKELIVGYSSGTSYPSNYDINVVDKLKLKVQGLKNGYFKLGYAAHLILWADGSISNIGSLAYSSFYIGRALTLEINSTNRGWINENKFYNVRFSNLLIDGDYGHNNNQFYSPSIEGSTITINRGNSNHFHNCRFEGDADIYLSKDAENNIFVKSWMSHNSVFLRNSDLFSFKTNEGNGNYLFSSHDSFFRKDVVFELNDKSDNLNLDVLTRESGKVRIKNSMALTRLFITDFIKVNNPLGFYLEGNINYFRFKLHIFDVNKNPILTEVPGFTNIISGKFNPEGYYEVPGSNLTKWGIPILSEKTDVKYFKLEITTGSAAGGTFEFFKLICYENVRSNTPIKYDSVYKKNTISGIPNAGTWAVGDIAYNTVTSAGSPLGWVCTAAGTPGTWEPFGVIGESQTVLKSPNGSRYKITVDDTGALTTTKL